MRASLVIAAHNEGDLVGRTIEACLDTMEGLGCEIVVADDASTDGSIDDLRRRFEQIRVVTNSERRGASATKDHGARASMGDVIVFLDAHCKPEPGAVGKLIEDVEEWEGEAIVTPSV